MNTFTNRLRIEFNIESIKRDFAFIRFTRERKGGWRGAPQLDRLLGEDFSASAVMFQYGKYAYAMFKHPVDVYNLLSRIRRDEDFGDDTAIEVPPAAVRTDAPDCICEAWLAQIFLNSIASSRSRFKQFHFSNLTGALLIVPELKSKFRDVVDVVQVSINRDFLFEAKVVRHRKLISVFTEIKEAKGKKINIKNRPRCVYQAGTGVLRRWLPSEGEPDAKKTYIPLGIEGKRANKPFLSFRSSEHFERSKAGILNQVLKKIREHLSQYMSVSLIPVEAPYTVELTDTIMKSPQQLWGRLDGQPIRIIDTVGSGDSSKLCESMMEELVPYLTDPRMLVRGIRARTGSLNIRIIHEAAHYKEIGKRDQYQKSTESCQRQHITVEGTEKMSRPIAKTIVKELLIKRDISDGRLGLFDWQGMGTKQTWIFGMCDEKAARIVFMEISSDGFFKFRELDGNDIFKNLEYQEYVELFQSARKDEWKTGMVLEGLIISEDGDKNLIFRTEEISLPDLERLENTISEVEAELPIEVRTGGALAAIIEQCFEACPELKDERVCDLEHHLRLKGSRKLTKAEFRQTFADSLGVIDKNDRIVTRSKTATVLRAHLLEQHGIRLIFPKDKSSKATLFDGTLNIKYFGENMTSAFYFAGERQESVQTSFKNACHIRKIEALEGSKLIFRELLPTMNVDFVRTGQSTVLPFPFKYLREYMALKK